MYFGLVDWKEHLLDPFLGVTEGSFMLHYLDLHRIQFSIDGSCHTTKVSGLLVTLQPVPDFGIKGVPEGFTEGHMVLVGFAVCRASQEELGLQVVQGHLFEVQIDLGLLLSAFPQVDTDSKPLAPAHSCLPKDE